jgi:hypothetical protein
MNSRERAIARVCSLFSLPTAFGSGTRIYEPKVCDPLASKKREIIGLAVRTAEMFESSRSHTREELASIAIKVTGCRGCINDLEAQAYEELLRGVSDLIAVDDSDASSTTG